MVKKLLKAAWPLGSPSIKFNYFSQKPFREFFAPRRKNVGKIVFRGNSMRTIRRMFNMLGINAVIDVSIIGVVRDFEAIKQDLRCHKELFIDFHHPRQLCKINSERISPHIAARQEEISFNTRDYNANRRLVGKLLNYSRFINPRAFEYSNFGANWELLDCSMPFPTLLWIPPPPPPSSLASFESFALTEAILLFSSFIMQIRWARRRRLPQTIAEPRASAALNLIISRASPATNLRALCLNNNQSSNKIIISKRFQLELISLRQFAQ